MARLRRSTTSTPGITRRRHGRGFAYADPDGQHISDPVSLQRIRELAIPPAWGDVWVCPDPWGHLQATGVDAAGRRQYLYHDAWQRHRKRKKFDHVLDFAESLPQLRRAIDEHLILRGMPFDRALACAVRLLDRGLFRIGSESYTDENGSFGLATLQKRHARIEKENLIFDYPAKGGQRRVVMLVDPKVLEVVRILKARRAGGAELLAYKRGGAWCDVSSADINLYIRNEIGGEFTAKDFRTWQATVLAAATLAREGAIDSKTARRRVVSETVRKVASALGNTAAVCRASYIDPRVFDRFDRGETIRSATRGLDLEKLSGPGLNGAVDAAVLELLGRQVDPAHRRQPRQAA